MIKILISLKSRVFLIVFLCFCAPLVLSSCQGNRKMESFKPMRPTGTHYAAYSMNGNWALEMELNGHFHFQDFVNGFELNAKTSEYVVKKEGYKQKLEWNMFSGKEVEQQIRFTVLQENCHNFGFVNNPFILEVFHDGGLIYRMGDCGTFHYEFPIEGTYKILTANGKDALTAYNLKEVPILDFQRTKISNMIHGRFACRFWQGDIRLLDKTISIQYNIHPTEDCIEYAELTNFMMAFGNKRFLYELSKNTKNSTILTLSNKYDTFVFLKIK